MSLISEKKILITGATGFVGGHLVRKLIGLGSDVTLLVRKSSDPEVVAEFERRGAAIIYGDVRNRPVVFEAVREKDYVFHLAALFRQAKHLDNVYWDINVQGTQNIVDAAEEHGISRLIHCSTVGVHSHIPSPPADETEAYRPGDIYQETKCEGEKLVRQRISEGRVKGVIIRPAMIWGEGDRRMLKLFRGVARRRFPVIGSGKTLTHWIYVHDLVDGFILAAEKDEALGQTYIIAGETPASISQLVETVADCAGVRPIPFQIPAPPVQLLGTLTEVVCKPLGIEPPIYRRRVDFFTKDRSFNTEKARRELGFRPKQDFRTEVENIYSWYNEHGWLN